MHWWLSIITTEWKCVSVVEQIGLNVLNVNCLERGILSRDYPPFRPSQSLAQMGEFLRSIHPFRFEYRKIAVWNHIFNRCLEACADVDWPWELPWNFGSRQAVYGGWHGLWKCSGCRRAEGPWSSSYVPPCGPDPGDGPAMAALRAEPFASEPGGGGTSACAGGGQADIGEHWGPEPTQNKEQFRLNSTLVAKRANSISLRVSNVGYCGGLQYDDWARGEARDSFTKNRSLFSKIYVKKCWTPATQPIINQHQSGRIHDSRPLSVNLCDFFFFS